MRNSSSMRTAPSRLRGRGKRHSSPRQFVSHIRPRLNPRPGMLRPLSHMCVARDGAILIGDRDRCGHTLFFRDEPRATRHFELRPGGFAPPDPHRRRSRGPRRPRSAPAGRARGARLRTLLRARQSSPHDTFCPPIGKLLSASRDSGRRSRRTLRVMSSGNGGICCPRGSPGGRGRQQFLRLTAARPRPITSRSSSATAAARTPAGPCRRRPS
jgi:hypothetical protein